MNFRIALACLLVALHGAATAQPGTAPITAVTLYPGSATIVRTARIEAGATRLVVPDITAQFSSVTLRVDADPGIRVGQVTTQDAARTESANAAEAAIEAKIRALRDQADALDVQAGAADVVKSYLERTGGPDGPADRRAPADAKSFTAYVAALNQAALDALGRKQQAALQKREIEQKIAALERDRQRARTDSRESRTLTIQLTAERSGTLRIAYQVSTAGWRPAYRAELNSTSSSVALERLAQVSQKTGEDWRGVKLSLSTAQPRQSPFAATPVPWLISYQPPAAEGGVRPQFAPPPPSAPPAPAVAAASRSAPEDDYRPPTFQNNSTFATEFVVPQPVTLPSDGREVALPLARQVLPARAYVQVSPRVSPVATVVAEVARPEAVWPDGNLQLVRDGNYIGATQWTPPATEKWNLSFGRDDLLQVSVAPLKADSGTTGVFDKRNVRDIHERFTLRNAHASAIDVLVLDAAPVSTSDEVKVKTAFNPPPSIEAWELRRGVVGWTRTLRAQETGTIDVSYTIEYPKEGRTLGLR